MKDRIIEFLKGLYEVYRIPYLYISQDGALLAYSIRQDMKIFNSSKTTKDFINLCYHDQKSYMTIYTFNMAMVGLYLNQTQEVILLGKVFIGLKTKPVLKKELLKIYNDNDNIQGRLDNLFLLPTFSESELLNVVRFTYYYLTKNHLCEDDFIIEQYKKVDKKSNSDDEEILYKKKEHGSYYFEQYLLKCIEQGDANKLLDHLKKNFTGKT